MIQVVYASRSAVPQGDQLTMLGAIQAVSYRRNAERSITGFLINDGQLFYQALEGPSSGVAALLDRIREDPRHSDMRVLGESSIQVRGFAEWSMVSWMRTAATLGIFARHGLSDRLDLRSVQAFRVLALARDLQACETAVRRPRSFRASVRPRALATR